MRTWSRILLAVFCLCVGATIAHAQSIDDIIKRGTLRVGLDMADAPYGYMDNNMQPAGLDYEIAALAAKTIGVQLQIVQVSAPTRIPTLVNGQADMMLGGFAVVATRALQVWYTIPYNSGPTGVIAPAAKNIPAIANLAGLKVGVVRGSTQDMTITSLAPPSANIVRFDDDASSISALISGQVDATVAGPTIATATAAKNPAMHIETKFTLMENPIAIGVRRGNVDLLLWLNTFIFNLKYNGTLAALHKKYDMPYSLPVF